MLKRMAEPRAGVITAKNSSSMSWSVVHGERRSKSWVRPGGENADSSASGAENLLNYKAQHKSTMMVLKVGEGGQLSQQLSGRTRAENGWKFSEK